MSNNTAVTFGATNQSVQANPAPEIQFYFSEEAKLAGLSFKNPRDLDAGFDLPAMADVEIAPHTISVIHTGIHTAIPEGWVGLIRDRSSVAVRGGHTIAGVIDASYRGEIKVAMYNLLSEPLRFTRGERIAQMVVVEHLPGRSARTVDSLEDLGSTERGAGGFGSTGR